MRSNWFRAVLVAAFLAAVAGLTAVRPAVAADNRTYVYLHDIAGFIYTAQVDPRNGKLLRTGQFQVAPTSPATTCDAQTLDYSPRLRLMVVSNGNGGAGTGTLSVLRIDPGGTAAILNNLFPVAGSGDITNVEVVETARRVMVYATDPTTNLIFTFILAPNGVLTPLGAPILSATPEPRGLGASRNFLFVGNGLGGPLQMYPIQPDGSLLTPPILVTLPGAVNPRFVRAQNEFVYVVDASTIPPPADAGGQIFGFRFGGTRQIRSLLGSPYVTADPNPCALSLCNDVILVAGQTATTSLQTGVLKRGIPSGRGMTVSARQVYEVAKITQRCDFVIAARTGANAEIRAFTMHKNGRFKLIQGGVAPLPGAVTLNGIEIVRNSP